MRYLGKACFLCEDDRNLVEIGASNTSVCPICIPEIALDLSQGQRILEHIGGHVLFDPKVDRTAHPCGLCLRPAPLCIFYLTKGKGARGSPKIDQGRSIGCSMKLNFSYTVAAESSSSSPCSNVPVQCPLCPKILPAVWKYFLKTHFEIQHPNAPMEAHSYLWKLSNFEVAEMKRIWEKRKNVSVRRPKRSNIAPLVISDAHRSGNPISESSNAHARTVDGDQETMHEDALGEESGERALDVPQGDERGGQQNCQSSDVASSHESEGPVTAVIIQEVISDRVVEFNPATVDSSTDQAAVSVVSDLNLSKWKSYSP